MTFQRSSGLRPRGIPSVAAPRLVPAVSIATRRLSLYASAVCQDTPLNTGLISALSRPAPAAVRFLSIEPLLEDLGDLGLSDVHWVIVGGESGPGARTCVLSGWNESTSTVTPRLCPSSSSNGAGSANPKPGVSFTTEHSMRCRNLREVRSPLTRIGQNASLRGRRNRRGGSITLPWFKSAPSTSRSNAFSWLDGWTFRWAAASNHLYSHTFV